MPPAMGSTSTSLLASLVAIAALGCLPSSDQSVGGSCRAGEQIACACASGQKGAQSCGRATLTFGACICDSGGPGDGGVVIDPVPDGAVAGGQDLAGSPADMALPPPILVATGNYWTCAKRPGEKVKCFGNWAQPNGPALAPTEIAGLTTDVVELAGGIYFTCARSSAGGVKCWGQQQTGLTPLGDGTETSHFTAMDVPGLTSGVTSIAGGEFNACAVQGGAVKCWGRTYGSMPTPIPGMSAGAVSVIVGAGHGCALTTAGGVKCWAASNAYGQAGHGAVGAGAVAAGDVTGLTAGVLAISGKQDTTCAQLAGGSVKCWGVNSYGALGNGTSGAGTDSVNPVVVTGLAGVGGISVGRGAGTVVLAGGAMKSWGSNQYRELGDGTSNAMAATPVPVSGVASGVTAISAGGDHACAAVGTALTCWGHNPFGELGTGAAGADSNTPVNVVGF